LTGRLIVRSAVASASQQRPRSARRGVSLLTTAALWLCSHAVASADGDSVYLDWQSPRAHGCPPRRVVERDVEQALGRRVFTPRRDAPLTVRGLAQARDGGIVLRLDARSAEGQLLGTRELRADDCVSLRNSIGLVLTLLVEHREQLADPLPELQPGLWVGALSMVLPRAVFGVGPSVALRLNDFPELRVDAAYWLPVELHTDGGKRAVLQGVSLAPRLCPRIAGDEQSLFGLRLCAGAQLGIWLLSQTRPDVSGSQARLLAHAQVELRGALRLRPLTLELSLGPLILLNRTSLYAVQDDGARVLLYRMPAFGVFLAFGLII